MSPPRHQVIRASAGAGKTYALTQHYLALLRDGAAPETILATTFTRKAAGEILARVLLSLAEEASRDPAAVPRLEGVCRSLHRLAIATLDRFFHRLARAFRWEVGLTTPATFVDERGAEAKRLRREAILAVLEELGDREAARELSRLLRDAHRGEARPRIAATLESLLEQLPEIAHAAPGEARWAPLAVPPTLSESELATAIAAIAALRERPLPRQIATAVEADVHRATEGDWEGFLGKGLPPKIRGDRCYYGETLPEEVIAAYAPVIAHATGLLLGRLRDHTRALYHLARLFDARFAAMRRERGLLFHRDVPAALHPELARWPAGTIDYRLDTRIEHLLLDEFQDTSPEQWNILRPFAERILAAPRGTVFCVGDVKQAIYGWRGATSAIFDRLHQSLRGLPQPLECHVSFRSSPVVLAAVNAVFGTLASNPALAADARQRWREVAQRWQERFHPHQANDPSRPGYVELATTSEPVEGEADRHLRDVADRVRALALAAPGATIGILVPRNDTVRDLIDRLQAVGVVASAEGQAALADDPAVETVLAALTLADHPGHTAAAYQVARSPLAEAVGFRRSEPPTAAEVARVSRQLRERLLDEGYAGVIARWFAACAAECDARGVDRWLQLLAAADAFERSASGPSRLRPAEFVAYARATRKEEPMPARVRVMTIHAAKGLEFDAVVLPALHERIGAAWSQSLAMEVRDEATGAVESVYRMPSQLLCSLSPELARARERWEAREFDEDLCALYVALTRARHGLYLWLPAAHQEKQLTAAAIVHGALAPAERWEPDRLLYAAGDRTWWRTLASAPAMPEEEVVAPIAMAPAGRGQRIWRVVVPSRLAHLGAAIDALAPPDDAPLRRGSVIHACCALVQWSDEPLPPETDLIEAARAAAPGESPAWYAEAIADFREWIAQPAVAAALARPAAAADGEILLWRERPFVVRDGDQVLHGIWDRVVIVRQPGEPPAIDLIDFKTDPLTEATRAAVIDRYRPQMAAYRRALARAMGVAEGRVRARLVFLAAGEVATV